MRNKMSYDHRQGKKRSKQIDHSISPRPGGGYDESYSIEKSKPKTTKSFTRNTRVSPSGDIKSIYSSTKVKQKNKGIKTVEKKGVYDSSKPKGKKGSMSNLTKGRKVTKSWK